MRFNTLLSLVSAMIIAAILGTFALYQWYPQALPGYMQPADEAYVSDPEPPILTDPADDPKPVVTEPPRKFVGGAENTSAPAAAASSKPAIMEEKQVEVIIERPAGLEEGTTQSVPTTEQKTTQNDVRSETQGTVTEEHSSSVPTSGDATGTMKQEDPSGAR